MNEPPDSERSSGSQAFRCGIGGSDSNPEVLIPDGNDANWYRKAIFATGGGHFPKCGNGAGLRRRVAQAMKRAEFKSGSAAPSCTSDAVRPRIPPTQEMVCFDKELLLPCLAF